MAKIHGRVVVAKADEVYLFISAEDSIRKELSEFFKFKVPGASFIPAVRKRFWDGYIRLFNLNTNKLYLGLFSYLKEFCEDRGYTIEGYEPDKDTFTIERYQEIVQDIPLELREYQKEAMAIMHDMLNEPTLASGASDLAENVIALIQTRKGHEVYFPADVTYKVGDMICLGSLGDLDPNDDDYYDKLADEATSIIVTIQDEGPGSVKVGAGAASAAEEKIRLTEYKNPNTRSVLNSIVSTHQDLFKSDPINTEEATRKLDEAEEYAREIGIEQDKIDEINSKAEEQAKKWAEKWRKDVKTGSENYTDEDWETLERNAVQFVRAHLLIAEINNKDMDYQKFSNFRVDNKRDGASMSRTDGVDCLGTVKPAPNMGFKLSEGGRFIPANVYSSRIGNSCKDKK